MLDDIHTYTQCIGITYGNTHVHLAIHTYIQLLHADEDGDGEVNFTEFLHALGIKDEAARNPDFVFMTRPDLSWKPQAQKLIMGMVNQTQTHRWLNGAHMMWPFMCQIEAWSKWSCVSDTIVAMPTFALSIFREYCFGYASCYLDATFRPRVVKMLPAFDRRSQGMATRDPLSYSGHGCFRCMQQHLTRNHALRGYLHLSIAWHINLHVNTRGDRPGPNGIDFPLYTFIS